MSSSPVAGSCYYPTSSRQLNVQRTSPRIHEIHALTKPDTPNSKEEGEVSYASAIELDGNVDPVEHAKQEAAKRRVNQAEQRKKCYENDKKRRARLHSELGMVDSLEKCVVSTDHLL